MSDEAVTNDYLTDSQEIAMSVLYVLSSSLSIVGSSTIIYKVLSDRWHATSYDRLMLGLSVCDLIASLGWALTPFFLPSESSPRVWAVGSEASCTFVGFMTQLGFSAVLYNGFLSFYYLLTIRYGIKRQVFAKRYEPWFHGTVFVFAFGTAIIGAVMGFYSEVQVGMGCWVNDWPKGCYDDCKSEEIGWVFGSVPVFFAIISLVVNNMLVYLHVRRVFHTTEVVETSRTQRQKIQKREVATQGLYYVATFIFCFWSAIALRAIEAFNNDPVDESKIYWMLMVQAGTLPLQGFLNMFVYNRPNYKRVRAAYPHLSILAAIRKACLDPKIPKLTEISVGSASLTSSSRKYKNKDRSGKNFSSGLQNIQEELDESDDEDGPAFSDDDNNNFDNDATYENWRSSGVNIGDDGGADEIIHNDDSLSPSHNNPHIPDSDDDDNNDMNEHASGMDDENINGKEEKPIVLSPRRPVSSRRIEMDGSLTNIKIDEGEDQQVLY